MIVSSDALVLRTMKYGNTSRIVTLLTRDFGKVSVIAKGARGARAKFGAALEPLNICHVVFYKKDTRDLHTLSQADLVTAADGLTCDAERILLGFAVLEYVAASVHGDEECERVYDIAVRALADIGGAGRRAASENDDTQADGKVTTSSPWHTGEAALAAFLAELAAVLGFEILADACIVCGMPLDDVLFTGRPAFDSEHGGIACARCAALSRGRMHDADVLRAVRDAVRGRRGLPTPRVGEPPAPYVTQADAQGRRHAVEMAALRILHQHVSSHIGGMREVRSLDMLERTRPQQA
jgi:recombinational DNA repair protein (RecF pathway)